MSDASESVESFEPQVANAPAKADTVAPKIDASISAQNKVAELRKLAREKVANFLREERGVPEPVLQPKEQIVKNAELASAATAPQQQLDLDKLSRDLEQRALQSLKAKQEAESLLAQAKQKEQELQESIAQPIEFIKKAGYTPEEWQALLLAGGKESAEMKKAKEAEARAKRAEEAALRATEELKTYQRNVLKAQAIKEIEPQLAEFPLTAKLVSSEQLLDMIQKHYRETGQKISVQDAAKTLEAQYEKQFSDLLADEKVAKKVGRRKVAEIDQKAEAGPTTLSNRVSNTTSAKPKLASLEERRAQAMRMLRDMGVK